MNPFGDKQGQAVGEGAVALQAGGNIVIQRNGMTATEVRELCELLLQSNFPRLRAEARAVAEEYVRQFASHLSEHLARKPEVIDFAKLADPDVQACINDAVQASARRGERANPELLCALIAERCRSQTTEFKELVLAEALQVVPKLTGKQIAALSVVYFVQHLTLANIADLAQLEPLGRDALPVSRTAEGVSLIQANHIVYTGACSFTSGFGEDVYRALRSKYASLGHTDNDAFRDELVTKAPSYAAIVDQYVADHLTNVHCSSVGFAIAATNLSAYVECGDLNEVLRGLR